MFDSAFASTRVLITIGRQQDWSTGWPVTAVSKRSANTKSVTTLLRSKICGQLLAWVVRLVGQWRAVRTTGWPDRRPLPAQRDRPRVLTALLEAGFGRFVR